MFGFLIFLINYMSLSSLIAKLRSLLAQIGDSSADLVKVLDVSEWNINEHCDSLRQQVDIARETALENIHKASNTLMIEIDAYERECLTSWRAAKESTERVVEDVSKRMRAFLAEKHAFLQSLQASDTQLILYYLLFRLRRNNSKRETKEIRYDLQDTKETLFYHLLLVLFICKLIWKVSKQETHN